MQACLGDQPSQTMPPEGDEALRPSNNGILPARIHRQIDNYPVSGRQCPSQRDIRTCQFDLHNTAIVTAIRGGIGSGGGSAGEAKRVQEELRVAARVLLKPLYILRRAPCADCLGETGAFIYVEAREPVMCQSSLVVETAKRVPCRFISSQ